MRCLAFLLAVLAPSASLAFVRSPHQTTSILLDAAARDRFAPEKLVLWYKQNVTSAELPIHRFERTASSVAEVKEPCILTIDGIRYNLTGWAKAHPGGAKVLEKLNNRDATKAFEAAHHSSAAVEMLRKFALPDASSAAQRTIPPHRFPRWRAKLFTKEDSIGVHKYLGVFCLLHFGFRFTQMYFGDPSAGLGSRLGKGPSWIPVTCLFPHALLSLSSLIFHTVPKDRVVGKPMIWKEYRVHNIVFGLRSVIAAALCATSIHFRNKPDIRRAAVIGSCMLVLLSNLVADLGTKCLRSNQYESTTATMPYWDGCSVSTQKRFKVFYAYSQFMATLAIIAAVNPAWPLSVLLAIQLASLFMTLVRKGFLSARGYHLAYTASLIAPYFVGIRSMLITRSLEFPSMLVMAGILYLLRCRGVNKYLLWVPVVTARVLVGDHYLSWHEW